MFFIQGIVHENIINIACLNVKHLLLALVGNGWVQGWSGFSLLIKSILDFADR